MRAVLTALVLAITPTQAFPNDCEPGLVDLRVFLYSGVVRDKDPDWFFLFEDPSDVSCQLTVETGDTQEVRLSDILLDDNTPEFKMFFEFGCHEPDASFTMVCYDADDFEPIVRDDAIVFVADPVTPWPPSGVKQTLVDNLDPRFTFTYKMEYESSEPEPEPQVPEIDDVPPPEENDDAKDNVGGGEERTEEDDDVPTVPAPAPGPSSKKKKSSSGVPLGIVVAAVAAAAVLAFCTGAACCVMRRKKEPKTVYVDEGMELGEVSVLEQKATAISSEDLEATPVAELPPSVGKMI